MPSPKPIPPFLDFPPELRNQIYDTAPTKDSLALFSTCKQIRAEGLPRTFVLYIGYRDHPSPFPSSRGPATELVQNLTLHINLGGGRPRAYDPRVIATAFGGTTILRKSCHVVLDYGSVGYILDHSGKTELFQSLRSLTGFKNVVVEIKYTGYVRPIGCRQLGGREVEEEWEVGSLRNWKVSARDALEEGLGKGVFGKREEARLIRFGPMEEKEKTEDVRKG